MQIYRRMTFEDRCHISALLQVNCSIVEISKLLGFHKTTIYREIKRNRKQEIYEAEEAMVKAAQRFKRCRRPKKITPHIKNEIGVYLEFGWSPEQISGRLKQENKLNISCQTIYRSITKNSLRSRLLRRGGRRGGGRYKQKKAKVKNKVMIEKRPSIVEQRKRIGDWERDGMYGAHRKQLLVFADRKSRLVKLNKMGTGKSKIVSSLTRNTLEALGKKVFTVTNDNGTEFSDSASLPFRVYHCTPHKPQQRGTVENSIGLLRQYIKRKTDLESLTELDLVDIENKINFRPRKCLDYKTPFEVFFNTKVALAL